MIRQWKIGSIVSELKRRLSVLLIVTLTLALVAVGVIWALSTIEGERNRTLNQYVLNEENGIYSQIVLYLDSFDLDNKTLHAYIHNDVGRRLRPDPGAIDPYDSLGNITILPLELTPAYYNPQLYIDPDDDVIVAGILAGPRWTLNPHNWHNVIEVEISLNGSETAFPFESYHQGLNFILYPPEEIELTEEESNIFGVWGLPMKFRIHEYVPGYRVTAQANYDHMLNISIERPWFILAEVTIIWLVLTLASSLLLVRAVKARRNGEMSTILVGVAALLIAIPTMRFALVPSDINSWTILDMGLVIPSLISLLAVLVAGYSTFRGLLQDKSSN